MSLLDHILDPIRMQIAPIAYKELMPVCRALHDVCRQYLAEACRQPKTVAGAVANLLWSDDIKAATKDLSVRIHFRTPRSEEDILFDSRKMPTRMAEIIVDHPEIWSPFFVTPIIDADIPLKNKLPFLGLSSDFVFFRYFKSALRLAPDAHNTSVLYLGPSDQLDYVLKRVSRATKEPSEILEACPRVETKTDQIKLDLVFRAILNMPVVEILRAIPERHCRTLLGVLLDHRNMELIKLEECEGPWSARMIAFVSRLLDLWLSICPSAALYHSLLYEPEDSMEKAYFRRGARWLRQRAIEMNLLPSNFDLM